MTNRRDLLKFTLTLPLARALAKQQRMQAKSCPPVNFALLKILLAGPFAIILNKVPQSDPPIISTVTAFTPMDPNHVFLFNGTAPPPLPPGKPTPNYQFKLPQDGLFPNTFPSIDHGCDDFNSESTFSDSPNHFVSIDLPCPEQITFTGRSADVKFADGHVGHMPLNHVLYYRVMQPNTSGITMLNNEFSDPCLAQSADTFSFEVGLPIPILPGVDPKVHARDFFNGKLLPDFPDIKDSEKLGTIQVLSTSMRKITARPTSGSQLGQVSATATAVECTGGGIIITTP